MLIRFYNEGYLSVSIVFSDIAPLKNRINSYSNRGEGGGLMASALDSGRMNSGNLFTSSSPPNSDH